MRMNCCLSRCRLFSLTLGDNGQGELNFFACVGGGSVKTHSHRAKVRIVFHICLFSIIFFAFSFSRTISLGLSRDLWGEKINK